jgi:hypothetical protein
VPVRSTRPSRRSRTVNSPRSETDHASSASSSTAAYGSPRSTHRTRPVLRSRTIISVGAGADSSPPGSADIMMGGLSRAYSPITQTYCRVLQRTAPVRASTADEEVLPSAKSSLITSTSGTCAAT